MKVSPLKRYSIPGYPIQEILAAHPELLRLVPKRWAHTPLVLSALSLVCLILAARDGRATDERGSTPRNVDPAAHSVAAATRVAPIFHHGDGRGGFGCVAVAAPVFLTEDEARQVIIEEAATAGIQFEKTSEVIDGIDIPVTDEFEGLAIDVRTRKPKTKISSLPLDGTDAKKNISFEFVSREDFDNWEIGEHAWNSSVSTCAPGPAAEVLQRGWDKTGVDRTIGIFYDPLSRYNFESSRETFFPASNNEAEAKQNSIRELREQVRDFVAWLKAQGII